MRLVRSLLIWLLALSLPLQGMAAASLLHCAPLHERMHAATTASTDGHEHVHGIAHAGSDSFAAASDGPAPDTAADETKSPPGQGSFSAGKCSACAACCAAWALPAGSLKVPVALDSQTVPPQPAIGADSFVPGGLERPPRPSFA